MQHRIAATIALGSLAGSLAAGAALASTSTTPGETTSTAAPTTIDADRCAENEAAGPIVFLTGFDFAATASMVDVQVAQANGYYEDRCLDVEIRPSFSTANYPLIASGGGQFASAGSFSEMVANSITQESDFVAVAVEGRTPIDVLIVKPEIGDGPEDLKDRTIGVKGALPTSTRIMLADAGLIEGQDFQTVLLDGYDPLAHFELPSIDAFPGYRSNEPRALERAGIDFVTIDPADYDVPGSYGVIYTTRTFLDEHPTAAADFLAATMQGLGDAMADPAAAAELAMKNAEANGNPNFLSLEGETDRWETDAADIAANTPDGTPYGVPDPELLQAELDAATGIGLFTGDPANPGEPPVATDYLPTS